MKFYLALCGLVALAACGVDGAPERPTGESAAQGGPVQISVGGTAKVGITGGSRR